MAKIIDMTHHGDALELSPDGYLDTSDVLCSIFEELVGLGKYELPKRTKIKVLGSKVYFPRDGNPYRSSVKIVRTLGYLKKKLGVEFDLEKYQEDKEFLMESLEKEAESRAAWGFYSNHMHNQKLAREESEFKRTLQNLSSEEQKKRVKERREKNTGVVFIGG